MYRAAARLLRRREATQAHGCRHRIGRENTHGVAKARKPIKVCIEGMEATTPAWPHLGVYMDVSTAIPEERQALAGAMFTRKGDVYVSANRHALTSDTTATVSVCYPFRKGLGTNDTLRLIAPFDENLYGVETRRIIGTTINRHSGCKVPWHCYASSVRAMTCVTGWTASPSSGMTSILKVAISLTQADGSIKSQRQPTSRKYGLPAEQRQEA